jgi:hypothetical protein
MSSGGGEPKGHEYAVWWRQGRGMVLNGMGKGAVERMLDGGWGRIEMDISMTSRKSGSHDKTGIARHWTR